METNYKKSGNGCKSRATHKEGKLDGLSESWYENGQRWKRKNYKDGAVVE